MEPTSPVNPFARDPGFDPFADNFDPLHSNPTQVAPNNVDQQFQDLQVKDIHVYISNIIYCLT
jgi:hypothetical protein